MSNSKKSEIVIEESSVSVGKSRVLLAHRLERCFTMLGFLTSETVNEGNVTNITNSIGQLGPQIQKCLRWSWQHFVDLSPSAHFHLPHRD